MRILQVIPYFSPVFGGSAVATFTTSRELAKRGHDITILTSDYKLSEDWIESLHQAKVYPIKTLANFSNFYMTPSMISYARGALEQFDLIHMHNFRSYQNVVIDHYARKAGVPYVLQAHGSLPRIFGKRKLKWIYDMFFGHNLLRNASKVVALTEVEAMQYMHMGVPEKRIAVIPNGIDILEYSGLPAKGCFKKKYDINKDERIVLFLGRIHRIKGIDILIRAFARVVEKLENVRLVIVGPNDGYLREVKTLARALKIDDSVVLTGPLYGRQKLEAYADADVCTLPSRYEIWGMTVLEAYACGKPVVASNIGGLKELVTNGTTGLLFEVGNVSQMADLMSCLLSDPLTARKMGLAGKRFLEENYTVQKVAHRLEELYERLQRDK